jgi:hypothetical protein
MKPVYLPFDVYEQHVTRWLNDNVGHMIGYRDEGGFYGVGWEFYLDLLFPDQMYWVALINNEDDATLFKLRWQ